MAKRIVVTGANSGIGLALCKQLAIDKGCYVYLGSRNAEKGAAALKTLVDADPACAGKIEVLQIDVNSGASVVTAAATVKEGGPLYAIVNNAGTGLAHGVEEASVLDTNLYGPKRVCDAFIPLLDPTQGRIVNVGSGAGPMWMVKQDVATKKLFSDPEVTWEAIDKFCKEQLAIPKEGMGAYGYSKAGLSAYTMTLAKTYPSLKSNCLSPGFIDTAIVKGFGASKPPEEGTVSVHHCLFADLEGNGRFYGSDGLRSPLCTMRQPGEPVYNGEPEL